MRVSVADQVAGSFGSLYSKSLARKYSPETLKPKVLLITPA